MLNHFLGQPEFRRVGVIPESRPALSRLSWLQRRNVSQAPKDRLALAS